MVEHSVSSIDFEKTFKSHALFIFAVCILFSIVNFVSKDILVGGLLIFMGFFIPLTATILMKNTSVTTRGIFLTQATVIVITVMSALNAELHSMFALFAANVALSCVYYNMKNLHICWILTNIIVLGAIPLKNMVYAGADVGLIIRGIVGINIAAAMIRFLLKNTIKYIADASESIHTTDGLLDDIKIKMEETRIISEKQSNIMKKVTEISGQLESSSNSMLKISERLSSASQEQTDTISNIYLNVEQFASETNECFNEAENAFKAAEQSTKMLNENNKNMNSMLQVMTEINNTSNRISGIVKTIDDIASQTNILALNAAVEASRAGTAGKGFSVVADEVRNLANKSAEAVKTTTNLISESISAVEEGTKFVNVVTEQMGSIIEYSKMSEEYAKKIAMLTKNQQNSVMNIKSRMEEVSNVTSKNTFIASESADIARSVAGEVEKMQQIVVK